jgi:hypothetical protein
MTTLCTLAASTTTTISKPRLSVTMNRLRPLIFLPASYPRVSRPTVLRQSEAEVVGMSVVALNRRGPGRVALGSAPAARDYQKRLVRIATGSDRAAEP